MPAGVGSLPLQTAFASNQTSQFFFAWSEFNLFDTLMVFLKEFFERVYHEKNQQKKKSIQITQQAKSKDDPCLDTVYITDQNFIKHVFSVH